MASIVVVDEGEELIVEGFPEEGAGFIHIELEAGK